MRLQVKKLTGPDEIEINGSSRNVSDAFTVQFNRPVDNTDTFPLTVRVIIYDSGGSERRNIDLVRNRNEITHDACSFTVAAANMQSLTGTHIYVHAVLVNTVAGAQNVSYNVNSYHETIKKVHLAANRQINHIYWSSSEQIRDMNSVENAVDTAAANDDVFLHIKAQGMYSDSVDAVIFVSEPVQTAIPGYASSNEVILKRIRVNLSHNRKVIALSMLDVRARYNRLKGSTSAGAISIAARIEEPFCRFYPSYIPWNTQNANRSGLLSVDITGAENPRRKTSTGTVYVNVYSADAEPVSVTPSGFTDFQLGFLGHLLGTGNIYEGKGGNWSKSAVVRYPFNFYELRLSDLVACNVLTVEDARALTLNTDTDALFTEQQMQEQFNKYTAFNGRSMMQRMSNANNRIDGDTVKKILDYLRRTGGRGIIDDGAYEVCRDAWQIQRSGANAIPADRYGSNGAECPPGAYTINLAAGSYQVYFSNSNAAHSKALFAGTNQRVGLAIHRGDSYYATGCTTLYCSYLDESDQLGIVNFLFQTGVDNLTGITNAIRNERDNKRLIFAYIEERSALLVQNYNRRWYDLVAPGRITINNGIDGSTSVRAGTNAAFTLRNIDNRNISGMNDIYKNSLAPDDTVAVEEIAGIRWQYRVGNGAFQDFAAGDGQWQITLPVADEWAGGRLTVRANVTTSRVNTGNYEDSASITVNVTNQENQNPRNNNQNRRNR
jgi:hypothetical protein